MTPPTPKFDNIMNESRGDTTNNKNTKQRTLNKTQIYTN